MYLHKKEKKKTSPRYQGNVSSIVLLAQPIGIPLYTVPPAIQQAIAEAPERIDELMLCLEETPPAVLTLPSLL